MSAVFGGAIAVLVSAPALSLVDNQTAVKATQAQGLTGLLQQHPREVESPARNAALTFIHALSAKDAATVWMFASEEDQDSFGTEKAVYDAYAETFPALAKADHVAVERAWQEGDTPFLEVKLTDDNGTTFRATLGFWLSDAGDWQLISCDVKPASDKVAGL